MNFCGDCGVNTSCDINAGINQGLLHVFVFTFPTCFHLLMWSYLPFYYTFVQLVMKHNQSAFILHVRWHEIWSLKLLWLPEFIAMVYDAVWPDWWYLLHRWDTKQHIAHSTAGYERSWPACVTPLRTWQIPGQPKLVSLGNFPTVKSSRKAFITQNLQGQPVKYWLFFKGNISNKVFYSILNDNSHSMKSTKTYSFNTALVYLDFIQHLITVIYLTR